VRALAEVLSQETELVAGLSARLGLTLSQLVPKLGRLTWSEGLSAAPPSAASWAVLAPDWRELLRGAFAELARALLLGQASVLLSDASLPELGQALARAAELAEVPAGTLAVLHGTTRELTALSASQAPTGPLVLSAGGLVERVAEWRRLEEGLRAQGRDLEARLFAVRAGTHDVAGARDLAEAAQEVLARTFGPATLCGQLAGALARVYCPARGFAAFTAHLLEGLEREGEAWARVPQLDDAALARVHAAWELGVDEGATLIAGGEEGPEPRSVLPTVLTNVEPYMVSAKRQDPLPVLCLLRT
jgi:acyl-CoA reductase-like NAD-dependent aldehyde dehydrogenase